MYHQPTLLLHKQKALKNMQFMLEKARKNEVRLRPHFKTHQSHEVGRWFREMGVQAITVASLKMAKYFAQDGWEDITVAIPFAPYNHIEINVLAKKISLNLITASPDNVQILSENLAEKVGIYLKIDVGTHRTGFLPHEKEAIEKTFEIIDNQPLITFKGFLAHAGHTYNARSHAEIEKIYHESISILQKLKNQYISRYPHLEISVGDTPSCSVINDFSGVDEIRPGNFVFYDLMQANISSCEEAQIAVALACPIIAKHKERLQIVIHGGAVHLSKDNVVLENGQKYFGKIVKLQENGWSEAIEGLLLVSVSQEHGIIQATPETFDLFQIGDEIGILPIHSCLVADLMGEFCVI